MIKRIVVPVVLTVLNVLVAHIAGCAIDMMPANISYQVPAITTLTIMVIVYTVVLDILFIAITRGK